MNGTLRILGDYEIVKQIGQGALGSVFLAEHRFMKKPFALKVFPEDLCSDRGFIQRFEEEVAHLATLNHPHIVKIHNISYDQGIYFLVSDCIVDADGEHTNLYHHQQGQSRPLQEDEIYQMLHQIASALDYAHNIKGKGAGIAHRGIKLNNILVGRGSEGIHLYLSDFGLSKVMGSGTFLTRTYHSIAETLGISLQQGTIEMEKAIPLHQSFIQGYAFLAPEQKDAALKIEQNSLTDSYAFGVLAYYLLTKELPEGYFDLPSVRLDRPAYDWDQLVKFCMQKRPEERPAQLVSLMESLKKGSRTEPLKEKNQVAEVNLKPVLHHATLERPILDPNPASVFQVDPMVKQYTPEQKENIEIEPIHTEMVVIEGGTFTRGSSQGNRDEMPKHEISIDSFAIDIHPVTNEQFVRFLEAMEGIKDSNHNDLINLKESRIHRSRGKCTIESGYLKHPVVGVTWYGAVAYAKWLGKRLPTEAEWEVASQSHKDHAEYPTGNDIEKTQANFFSSDTTSVMSYPSNDNGLYDMAGNVYEWCQDWYGYNYYEISVQEPFNPTGPLQGVYRVLRGGCWKGLKEDLRSAKRHRNNPGTGNSTYGFRCAADVR
ncbi:Serine/threonine-protein kinase pkn1 [Waddlia chondrophila 2032/99]|uniref:non-specific serine/threonine protein kinase n=2 Tax=Waddlia chondrophila TaxID=71667 RepID=D6YW56_WADCW|nr:bifunctional serine/threonine-protein kinase/formylglycine-generating enzyme family protein [Waddlia chondrophila]ADI38367.1 putative serine/threonine-protein kinase pkn1 [Waddlia chondrophila WSU 86-1044]CCB91454.1 Serine/threonine-protein kinase pkn1 [Waddlia chondrophila 2032/99]